MSCPNCDCHVDGGERDWKISELTYILMIGTGSWKCLCDCVTEKSVKEEEGEESELFGPRANGNHRSGRWTCLGSVWCCGNTSDC